MKLNLYPCFKHLEKFDNINVYSDTHFADEEMAKLRGISDEQQVKNINKVGGKKTVNIFLGDVCAEDHLEEGLKFVKDIKGYKILIMGNHDKGISNYQKKTYTAQFCPHCHKEVPQGTYKAFTEETYVATNHMIGGTCPHCGKYAKDSAWGSRFEREVDNGLFDEVYSGEVNLNEKIKLSHIALPTVPHMVNIHGHDHSGKSRDKHHINVCGEAINFTPVSLIALNKNGCFKCAKDINRDTIDAATKKSRKKQN